MISVVHYTPELKVSRSMVDATLPSLKRLGWNPILQQGYTPLTTPRCSIMKRSFLSADEGIKQRTRLACSMNHYRFWKRVVEAGEPMVFVEHDVAAIREPSPPEYEIEFLATAYICPIHKNQNRFMTAFRNRNQGVHPVEYPLYNLKYPNSNEYFGSLFLPNTAAYTCTPRAARKLIEAFETFGAERSDAQINTSIVEIGFRTPSAFEYLTNPNTSSGECWAGEGVRCE